MCSGTGRVPEFAPVSMRPAIPSSSSYMPKERACAAPRHAVCGVSSGLALGLQACDRDNMEVYTSVQVIKHATGTHVHRQRGMATLASICAQILLERVRKGYDILVMLVCALPCFRCCIPPTLNIEHYFSCPNLGYFSLGHIQRKQKHRGDSIHSPW